MKFIFSLSFLLFYLPVISQELLPIKGRVVDSIAVSASQGETFALYLPKSHRPDTPASVVFIFDPAARGAAGVKPFIPAAEKYNYILICSNDSKNGPYEQNFQVVNRLLNHAFTNFNIHEKGIYTSGFSGGSRLATTIAVLTNSMQGVIGCGAGFSVNPGHFPSLNNTFSYVGLVGDRDMNYQEMQKAVGWLSSMKIENELFIYEDDHKWPPSEQLVRAFSWLELQAYKKGVKYVDHSVIRSIYTDEFDRAKALEQEGKVSHAVKEYERAIRNFTDYYDLDSIKLKIKALKKTRAYKDAIKDFKKTARLEDTLSLKYRRKYNEEVALGKIEDDFVWWKKQLKKLDETYIASDSDYLQKMGKRLRYQLFALAIESFAIYVRKQEEIKAQYAAQFLEIQGPNNPYFHYRLALGFAKLGLKERSLNHLEAALINGWQRLEGLKTAEEFKVFEGDNRFTALLEKFGG